MQRSSRRECFLSLLIDALGEPLVTALAGMGAPRSLARALAGPRDTLMCDGRFPRRLFESMADPKLYVVPLGGLGEFGMNSMALRYGDEIIVIDAGMMFPDAEVLG